MVEVLSGREYVFVNMDETTVSKIEPQSAGFVPHRRVQQERKLFRKRRKPDRHDVRTCLLGTVCSDPVLQPHLPQVILPAYTQNARPPEAVLAEYRRTRRPLEYWHNTNGWSTARHVMRWLTRLRSIISSVRPSTWIIVVLDCATAHLNADVLRHARRLNLLILIIPAGLTFAFQVLDAYIYSDLKRRIRRGFTRAMAASNGGQLDRLARIRSIGVAVHESVVQVDCSEYFRRVGLCNDLNVLSDDVGNLVENQIIVPALPLRAEFAMMVGRPPDTRVTRVLHSLAMSGWFHLRSLPLAAGAPAGAPAEVVARVAARRRGRDLPQDRPVLWDDVRMSSLRRLDQERAVVVPAVEEALNVFLDV